MARRKITVSMMDKLSPPEQRFIKEYIRTGSGKKAVEIAYQGQTFKPHKTKLGLSSGAAFKATSLLSGNNKGVKIALKEVLAAENITAKTVAVALSEEIWEKPATTTSERAIRLRAIDMAAKILNMYSEDIKRDEDIPVKIIMESEINEPEPDPEDIRKEEIFETQKTLDNIIVENSDGTEDSTTSSPPIENPTVS